MNTVIRNAQKEDKKLIVDFQLKMALETEDLDLDRSLLEKGVDSVIGDTNKARYFIAETDNVVSGMLMITTEWSDWRNGWVWWIQSVYVSSEYRKSGIYKTLYQHVKEIVRVSADIKGLRLYVDKRNIQAQKVYDALGMNGDHYITYEWMKNENE